MAAVAVDSPLTTQGLLKTPNVAVQPAELIEEEDIEPLTVDHLLKIRARQVTADEALIAYPDSGTHYVGYSARDLDSFVETAARYYSSIIPQRTNSSQPVQVVGLLGPSDLDYLITCLAITRLGHTALLLSTRISEAAYESLLVTTKASTFLYHESFAWAADFVKSKLPEVTSSRTKTIQEITLAKSVPLRPSSLDLNKEAKQLCFIIHSSGSTGLPKPIYQTHRACLYSYSQSFGLVSHITLPLYHNHGISCLFRAIYARRKIYIHNARLPLARQHLIATLKEHPDIKILYGVPYALKLLSETDEGMQLLSSLEIVMFGGSPCPKPIGDRLVANGVNLVGHYGATEVGQLMTSFRNFKDDHDWDWLRVPNYLKPYLSMEPRGANVFELVVKDGWKSKVASNREDGSYATKDLFEPHSTLPDTWRYLSRLDDTVTLENGEKVNPLPIEGVFRQSPHVAEAVVFGIGKARAGVFLIPPPSSPLSAEETANAVWPMIVDMNESISAWSRISRDMIIVLPHDVSYRRTDKGTVIRAAFYKDFAAQIDSAYADEQCGTLILPESELLAFLRSAVDSIVRIKNGSTWGDQTDLFHFGVDSLQAMQIRSHILKNIDLKGCQLGRNFVFDFPTVSAIAKHILSLQGGTSTMVDVSVEERMQSMIEKYSVFKKHQPVADAADGKYFVITGATGSLGAHAVCQLALQNSVKRIYCLVRANDVASAGHRVRQSLKARRLYHRLDISSQAKIVAVPASFDDPGLGLTEAHYDEISSNITHLLHFAWSVNFNKRLESFEKDCIASVQHLINLCLSAKRPEPANFNFCSSVSATAATAGGIVPEALPQSLSYAQNMGYAQSKHVAEHLCHRAAEQTGIKSRVLRAGQVIGDTQHGVWNDTEAIPMIFQTALTVGALPQLDERPSWLPVDTVASTCVEIACSAASSGFMNVQNHRTFHWTKDLLPLLRDAGLEFEEVDQREWIQRLRKSSDDPVANPPIKLLDFFASKYDTERPRTSLAYATEKAQSYSLSLQNAGIVDNRFMTKIVAYLKNECWSKEPRQPLAIIIGGPCGTGKTTVANAIATAYSLPIIEGDELHSKACREKMADGTPLNDSERFAWLERIRGAIMGTMSTAKAGGVVVSCSALKVSYREELRALRDIAGIRTVFAMLETSQRNVLKSRLSNRQGHYMKEAMVDTQVECLEVPRVHEFDITRVNSAREVDAVLAEVKEIVEDALRG